MPDDDLQAALTRFDRACQQRRTELAAECVHEDFALMLVHPTLAIVPRGRWMEMLPAYLIHERLVEEMRTDVDGDCAAATNGSP